MIIVVYGKNHKENKENGIERKHSTQRTMKQWMSEEEEGRSCNDKQYKLRTDKSVCFGRVQIFKNHFVAFLIAFVDSQHHR